jgi:histidyl-tRNA synthetase
MGIQKPSTPKGTRDFSPDEMMRRNFIFDTIRSVFKKYGYQPIETPAMENIESLTGKYGEEGDQLLFKILNSRPFEAKDEKKQQMRDAFERTLQQNTNSDILTEKALRYDLTVPFARYVVQHQNEITFPFKRYQIQPVWRADRPQKGRYREFFQCDADVIGSTSLINEVELVQMIDEVFTGFNVPVTVKINNRKILSGIAEVIGEKEKIVDITVAIDKLDKIGVEGVNKELQEKGISVSAIEKLQPLISFSGDFNAKIALLESLISTSEIGRKGIEEIRFVFAVLGNGEQSTLNGKLRTANCELDITLARGLNYYTGAIFEVKANKGTLTSSICGGGRYDDLTGIFGLPDVSGVGISFGIDRIFDVLNEVGYPEDVTAKEGTRVLFANFGGEDEMHSLKLLKQVRDAGIAAEIYLDAVKMGKQFKYADAKKIPFVAIIGENERKTNSITLKNMKSGEQVAVSFSDMIERLKS